MTARDVVLERVRQAVGGAAAGSGAAALRRRGLDAGTRGSRRSWIVFATTARPCSRSTTPRLAVAEVLATQGARRIGIPRDLDARLRPAGVELVEDDALSPQQLDELDGALTTCAAACAVTGTIALDGGPGRGDEP